MNKYIRKISYISIAALILSLSITPILSIVVAQENEKRSQITMENHVNKNFIILNGYGLVTGKQDDQIYRSHIKLVGQVIGHANENSSSSKQFNIIRGGLVILDNGTRIKYSIVNNTWTGTIGKGKFVSNGEVKDEEGTQYRVHLKGEAVRRSERGVLMIVEGELNGYGVNYKLQYVILLQYRDIISTIQITNSTV